MTETNKKVLELLKQNKNLKEISDELKISEKQLYIRIKQIIKYGYGLLPTYSYNSNIYYGIKNTMEPKKNTNSVRIGIPKNEESFRCIVISDLHVGNIDANIKLLNEVYEYAVKNGINIILNCGDIIEGDYTTSKKSISDYEAQTYELIKKYPYDKSINNFMILGNHDLHSLTNNGFNLLERIKNARYDLIPIGYGQGFVNIKDDSISLVHRLGESKEIKGSSKLVLSGHGHMMKTKLYDRLLLGVPTLSYVSTNNQQDIIPGFIDLNIVFDKNNFNFLSAKHMIITPQIFQASETRYKYKANRKE